MTLLYSSNSEFIEKLAKITEINLDKREFNVMELARIAGISRSQVHRKLKLIRNQSASQFIREIRLLKAMEMLEQGELNISEVSYSVGFGSSSYFIRCFHEYFGYPPGEFKKYNPREDAGMEPKENPGEMRSRFRSETGKIILGGVEKFIRGPYPAIAGIIIVAILSFFIYRQLSKQVISDKSIAILPFKFSRDDVEIGFLADGIMEEILYNLWQVHDLKVRSWITAESYNDSNISLPVIAAEMGVSYILDGAIIKIEEKLLIFINLIEARNDNHIWFRRYNPELETIPQIAADVSEHVVVALQAEISSNETKKIEKVYTENKEAYSLYQKGRFLWQRRTNDDIVKSIKCYNLALEKDPGFALAYAGLAASYSSLTLLKYYPSEEGYAKTRGFADKALNIDYNLAEVHAVIGDIEKWYNRDWNLAEKELLMALEIDPDNAPANACFAKFLHNQGRLQEARFFINEAIKMEPFVPAWYSYSSIIYYDEGKFNEALNENEKILEFGKNIREDYFRQFRILVHLGKYLNAIEALKKIEWHASPNENYNDKLHQAYTDTGINGVIQWIIENNYFSGIQNPNTSEIHFINACLFGMMGNRDSCLAHLEKINELGGSPSLCRIKSHFDFRILHGNPKFTKLLEEIYLAD